MSPTDIAERHGAERKRLIRAVEREGVAAWRNVDRAAIETSWVNLAPRVMAVLIAAQSAAASQSEGYTAAMLAELGIDNDPAGQVAPDAFAGQAADGRPLGSLMLAPVMYARRELGRGRSLAQSMASGQAALRLMLRTEVADAGRTADGVTVAARPRVMYTRYATPPSCPRCVILAGRTYRYSQGFQRHPGCDCQMIPSTQKASEDLISDPREAFERGQIRGLSQADAQAIADGADINQVVNAHRGMFTAGGRKFTRALAGRRGIPAVRIRPEQIYRDATSREDAVRLLRLHGYLR